MSGIAALTVKNRIPSIPEQFCKILFVLYSVGMKKEVEKLNQETFYKYSYMESLQRNILQRLIHENLSNDFATIITNTQTANPSR